MLDFEPVSSHQAQGVVSNKSGPRPHDGADHSRVKQLEIEAFAKFGSGIVAGNGHKRHKNTKRAERYQKIRFVTSRLQNMDLG